MSTAKYWDEIARRTKEHYRSKIMADYHQCENTILFNQWCGLIENKSILITDLFNEAFDREELPQQFYSPNRNIIGMDISEIVVKRTQMKYSTNINIVCDVNYLSFKDNSFDIVISPSTLDHTPKINLSHSLREIRRVLKKKGTLIITLHNKQNAFLYFYWLKLYQLLKLSNALPFHLELYSKKQIIQLLKRNQFYVEESTATSHILFPISLLYYLRKKGFLKIYNFLKKKMYNIRILGKLITKYFTGEFIAVKAKKVSI